MDANVKAILAKGHLCVAEQNRLAWRLAHILRMDVQKVFTWPLMLAVRAFIPDAFVIEEEMVRRGEYSDEADEDGNLKESLIDAIGRVYGHEAVAIINKLLETGGEDAAD